MCGGFYLASSGFGLWATLRGQICSEAGYNNLMIHPWNIIVTQLLVNIVISIITSVRTDENV